MRPQDAFQRACARALVHECACACAQAAGVARERATRGCASPYMYIYVFVVVYMILFIILWYLLLIVPGIIAAYSYSMTFYILADDPNISAIDALNKSKSMMDGHKMDLFLMSLSFIGWALLCILTLGIGLLWLIPYMNVSIAKFYQDIKGDEETYTSNLGLLDDMV